VASVAEAKHRSWSALLASVTVRSASHVGDTQFLGCGFGRTLGPGDRRSGSTSSIASRYGPVGFRTHWARPDAQTAGRCDGRSGHLNRRRSPGSATVEASWWFQPGQSCDYGRNESTTRSPRAAGLRWSSDRVSSCLVCGEAHQTASAGDAATGSRRRTSSGLIPASGAGQVTRSASCPSRPHGRCCQVE